MGFLGIDTSNYMTSAAVLSESGDIIQQKMPLSVESGKTGLRQSDAVFAHVKQLGGLIENIICKKKETICAVGVSTVPRDATGSYMPCFLAGKMCAQSVAAALKVPLYTFSHQAGHIAAAIFDAGLDELFGREFLAFHVSGGTTECLLIEPDEAVGNPFKITAIAGSLDLYAGQLIDRTGVMLGLGFPAGPALEELARESDRDFKIKASFKGLDCCLSGIENQCAAMLAKNERPCDIAKFCIQSVEAAILEMTARVTGLYPDRKLVYAGGVMSNAMIRDSVKRCYDAAFASPAFSSDNAAGIAVLCKKSYQKERLD